MATLDVANEILRQRGGNRFCAMTGARNLVGAEKSLNFKLPRGFAKDGINGVQITLDPTDTYTVRFYKLGTARSGYRLTDVLVREGLYGDQLRTIFESATGLHTNL